MLHSELAVVTRRYRRYQRRNLPSSGYFNVHPCFDSFVDSSTAYFFIILSTFLGECMRSCLLKFCHRPSRRQKSLNLAVGVIKWSVEGRLPVVLACENDGTRDFQVRVSLLFRFRGHDVSYSGNINVWYVNDCIVLHSTQHSGFKKQFNFNSIHYH
jgi:hypothetical protein